MFKSMLKSMTQWIRFSGLAAFFSIITLLVLFWWFAAAPLIKYSIEGLGRELAKAQVDVQEVSLSFDPFGIQLQGIRVENSDDTNENLVEVGKVAADVELLPLLLGKVIINQVALTDVAFSTPRGNSAAAGHESSDVLKEGSQAAQASDKKDSPFLADQAASALSQNLPSAEELLAREPLQTQIQGQVFQTSVKQGQQELNALLKSVPDQDQLQVYQHEISNIFSGRFESVKDFEQRQQQFEALKDKINADKKALSTAKKALAERKVNLKRQWQALQKAPQQDIDKLSSKYKLDAGGAANISRLLLGDEVGVWADKGLYWYQKLSPLLASDKEGAKEEGADESLTQRQSGRFVQFPSDRPVPDFIIRDLTMSVSLPIGQIEVKGYDITPQQKVIGRATRFVATGEKLKNIESLRLNVESDHRTAPGGESFELNITNVGVKDHSLGAAGLRLDQSQVQVRGQGRVQSGQLSSQLTALFEHARFSSKDKTQLGQEMSAALAHVERFDVTAEAKGKVLEPKVSLHSDLDKKLNAAFKARIAEKKQALERDLRKRLEQKLLAYGGDYGQQLGALNESEDALADAQASLTQMGKSKMSSFADQQKAEAQARFTAEKKKAKLAAQAKLKAAADKERKALEKKAKEAFKKLF